jgi:hypothetical protein
MSKGAQEPQELAVTDPFLDRPHQPVMRDSSKHEAMSVSTTHRLPASTRR